MELYKACEILRDYHQHFRLSPEKFWNRHAEIEEALGTLLRFHEDKAPVIGKIHFIPPDIHTEDVVMFSKIDDCHVRFMTRTEEYLMIKRYDPALEDPFIKKVAPYHPCSFYRYKDKKWTRVAIDRIEISTSVPSDYEIEGVIDYV